MPKEKKQQEFTGRSPSVPGPLRIWKNRSSLPVVHTGDFVGHLIDVSTINRVKVAQTFLKKLRVDPNATQVFEGHPFHINLISILHFSILGF